MYTREATGQKVRFIYQGKNGRDPQNCFEDLSKVIMQEMNGGITIGVQTVIDRESGVYSYDHLRLNDQGQITFNFYDSGRDLTKRAKSRLETLANEKCFKIEVFDN